MNTLRIASMAVVAALAWGAGSVGANGHVSNDIRSVHGQRVAALFAQIMVMEELQSLSDLVLVERDEPQRGQVLSLQSPVRTLHEERYRIMRTRDLDAPESLARRFIQAGLAARVLGSSNARAL